jgi:predicted PurR-regulated permease PerM
MALSFLSRLRSATSKATDSEAPPTPVNSEAITSLFAPPDWLRNLGASAWLIVGVLIVVLGLVWLLGATSSIVMPVVTASIIAAVAGPLVGWMNRHGFPRGAGAALLMIGVFAIIIVVFVVVVGGVIGQVDSLNSQLQAASDQITEWAKDAGIDSATADANQQAADNSAKDIFDALVNGLATTATALSSMAMFFAFLLLSLFFLLKDGPQIRAWVERQVGIPPEMAHAVSGRILQSLRGYFLGVTAIAVFNAGVVSLGAWLLDVPLVGTIAIVTFIGAYIPYVGAWAAGAFSVLMALGGAGTDAAIAMAIIQLLANGILQQLVQPIAYGAALGIHPLAVLIVTIAGGALFGMIGLVLAAPVTAAVVRIVADVAAAREAPPAAAHQTA